MTELTRSYQPLWPVIEPQIAATQPGGRLPTVNAQGWIEPIHSPLRADEHASFSVKPDSATDPGGWKDHTTGEHGSIAELARKLGVLPFPGPQPGRPHHEQSMEEFCKDRHLDRGMLQNVWDVNEITFSGRRALRYPTGRGDRLKFLDGAKPKYMWAEAGGGAHLYGIGACRGIGGHVIYLVNGEVSVWAALQERVPAVCLCVGEGTPPTRELTEELQREGFDDVRVVYDLDATGRAGARKVVEALRVAGLHAKALELPADLGEGADVDDLHRRVGADLGAALEGLPELQPLAAQGVGTLLSDVQAEEVRWLWHGYIPLGKLCILDGDPGLGKSTATLDLAARVSTGKEMPDGSPGIAGGVVLLTAEDGLADTVRPRLEVHGADLTRIVAVSSVGEGDDQRPVTLPEDLPRLREAIERVEAKLVVIDPLMAYLGARVDSHRDQDVRRVLAAMAALAQDTGVAIVIVRHLNKAAGGNPLYRGGGSIGIIGAARAGLLVARHPEVESQRVLAPTKSNLARETTSIAFILDDIGGVPRVRWLGASELTAAVLLADFGALEGGRGPRNEEKVFLEGLLADGVQVAVAELQREAKGAGFSWRSVQRAASDLGIVKRKVGQPGDEGQHWVWSLPAEDDHGVPQMTTPEDRRSSEEFASFETN
jgi:AAA domain